MLRILAISSFFFVLLLAKLVTEESDIKVRDVDILIIYRVFVRAGCATQ
jgi:hypothetical protein